MKRIGILLVLAILVSVYVIMDCCPPEIIVQNQLCTKQGTEYSLSYKEALDIAVNSECADYVLKETHVCNGITGTWWIDLESNKANCNPACVVNVQTKEAEINWRCTGLLPE